MKLVINRCFGGFSLSPLAQEALAQKKGRATAPQDQRPLDRADKDLVEIVEELGSLADGGYAELEVIEIPDGVNYTIEKYDGIESVHEVHRSWP